MWGIFRDNELHVKVDILLGRTSQLTAHVVDLTQAIKILLERVEKMSAANDLLVDEVAALKSVVESAVTLISGLVDQFKNAATMEEVQAIVAEIEVQKQFLADAVAAGTAPVA